MQLSESDDTEDRERLVVPRGREPLHPALGSSAVITNSARVSRSGKQLRGVLQGLVHQP